ncbi:hypothetical protein ACHAXR_008974 [Thalassiosira sp. AJA248-18]
MASIMRSRRDHPTKKAAIILLLGTVATLFVFNHEITAPPFHRIIQYHHLSKIYIPQSLDTAAKRRLSTSLHLGGGDCKWQPPRQMVPDDIDFYKTLVTGFPSGDMRMIWLQMEALAGWPTKDEWSFAYGGMSNHPFIKANYPHHEGFWGWGTAADQVVLNVPYIRRSMVELWGDPSVRHEYLYKENPSADAMYEWRDLRVMDECHWYGWLIDYWMEGGLLRDIFTHRTITLDHWNDIMQRPFYPREHLNFDRWSDPNVVVPPTYDPHCKNGEISNGCEPVEVISADRLLDLTRGPDETAKIATVLLNDSKIGQHVISHQAWDCMWAELILHKKGPKAMYDESRGYVDREYNFSVDMLDGMILELNRLIAKYSSDVWATKPTANRLVELLMEHVFHLRVELDEVKSGARQLRDKDFLGPRTREVRRRQRRAKQSAFGWSPKVNSVPLIMDHHDHLNALGQRRFMNRRMKAISNP